MLHDKDLRPHLEYALCGQRDAPAARQHAGLRIVDEQHVETLQHFEQSWLVILDPVVHGVAAHQLRLGHGFAHAPLQHRIDVGEKEKF